MEKGIWGQNFSSKNLRGESSGSSPDRPGADYVSDDALSSVDWPLDQPEPAESQGKWEKAFSNRVAGAAGSRASSNAASPQVNSRPQRPGYEVPIFREKSKSGPPLLDELGDFLDKIWINLNLKTAHQYPKTFLFCGATRGVGVTFLSFYMSLSIALERNMRVLYVDANVDVPHASSVIPNIQSYAGLATYLAGYQSPETLILQTQYKNLSALPSGSNEMVRQANSDQRDARTISEFISYCKAHYDVTIFDGQPAVEFPSTTAFARAVDNTILVCKYGVSRREIARLVIDKLKENGVSLAGVILNERRLPIPASVYRILK
ncbi:MAG: AAA family ATPase [Syntrophobacteraceae bacterium]